jgi:HD-like signal output (HDOD) protein
MEKHKNFESKVAELVRRLPPMPGSIDRILLAANEPHVNDENLIELVKRDPGLCADLLHLANTFSIRPQGHDDTLEEAVNSVGIKPLIQLTGIWYTKGMIQKEFAALKRLSEYFRHSQEISFACRVLAEVTNMTKHDCEVSCVAGLIHDMGRLVIMLAGNKLTNHLMGTQWDMMKSIVNHEKELFGMDHCHIGMQVCRKWNFSSLLQDGVLRHHSPLIDGDFNHLGAIIFTSHFVSCSDFTGDMLSSMLPAELLDRLNLRLVDFEEAKFQYASRISSAL